MTVADCGVQAGDVRVVQLAGEICERLMGHQSLQWQALFAHRFGYGVLADVYGLFAALLGEPLTDLVTGSWAPDEGQPVT